MLDALLMLFKELFFYAAYVSNHSSFPEPLPPDQEKLAIAQMLDGDEAARQKLIEHNLRLVAHVAKKYATTGRETDDLVSIGTIGLIKAVTTFKSGRGTQLATYAARCIDNEILMSIRAEKKKKNEVSIQEPIGIDREGNEISLSDVLGSCIEEVPDEVELRLQVEHLQKVLLSSLSLREKIVIELRYGLCNGCCYPQREVAQRLGISRSYVSERG